MLRIFVEKIVLDGSFQGFQLAALFLYRPTRTYAAAWFIDHRTDLGKFHST
jgi:hypothetical protein